LSQPELPPRLEYGAYAFDESALTADPIALFREWFGQAVAAGIAEANGVCLCSTDPQDGPDGRIVLLKGYGEAGFAFYTNYQSAKGEQLRVDPRACMVFWWQPMRRQVRVRGRVERLVEEDSDLYFQSRPRATQLGAWASAQSRPIGSRRELEGRLAEVEKSYRDDQPVPRPPHWGGYRLVPQEIEFWQGRDSRLHDRFLYRLEEAGSWSVRRLMP
jgi:pyridoxamine 5'-phosphate oxidase